MLYCTTTRTDLADVVSARTDLQGARAGSYPAALEVGTVLIRALATISSN